jgi:hypothetical protein
MGDIREQLNVRLGELRRTASNDAMWVREGAAPNSAYYERASRNLAELRDVEATLATMQLADAQLEVAKAQRDVAEQQRLANAADATKRSTAEETAFWARRFLTSITVANVGALVAVLLFLSKPDSPLVPMSTATLAVQFFTLGTIVGGAYPLAKMLALWIWGDRRKPLHAVVVADFCLPALVAGSLILGAGITTRAVFDLYQTRARTAEQAAKQIHRDGLSADAGAAQQAGQQAQGEGAEGPQPRQPAGAGAP